jgi:hypothetical protein
MMQQDRGLGYESTTVAATEEEISTNSKSSHEETEGSLLVSICVGPAFQ